MKTIYSLLFTFLILSVTAAAQTFELNGQIRPRAEYRHGYKSLIDDGVKPGFAISQRTRLNLKYYSKQFNSVISIQDIRIWGDVKTSNKSDVNGLMVNQAWGELFITPKFSVKAGRQTISYDDQRIFGFSDWTQQSRSSDALLIKYTQSETSMLHLGFAYNQSAEKDTGNFYSLNYFKSVQYAWAHHEFKYVSVSFLFGNFGMPYNTTTGENIPIQEIKYIQVFGPYLTFKKGYLKINLAGYYQSGKNDKNVPKSAWYAGADAVYAVSKFGLGAGFQFLSGNDQVNSGNKDHEFVITSGTGHKFNGWMDYFYAGSSHKGVGLLDMYIPVTYKKDKLSSEFQLHYYKAAANVSYPGNPAATMNAGLGTEAGIMITYTFSPEMSISGGYSQMFGTETLQALKGGNRELTQNWAWLMLTFNPVFFRSEK